MYTPKFYHYNSVASTNDTAFELLAKNEKCVVITADWQSAGRGRNGNTWISRENSNLLFSYGLVHKDDNPKLYLLQVIGTLAVKELLAKYIESDYIRIKYPNDVYVKNSINAGDFKKISGIISETNYVNKDICYSVIGIGINVNNTPGLASIQNAAALADCIDISKNNIDLKNINLKEMINGLADNISKLLLYSEDEIKSKWEKELNIYNKKIKLIKNNDDILYKAVRIMNDCRLVILDEFNNEKIIDNGDSIRYKLD